MFIQFNMMREYKGIEATVMSFCLTLNKINTSALSQGMINFALLEKKKFLKVK